MKDIWKKNSSVFLQTKKAFFVIILFSFSSISLNAQIVEPLYRYGVEEYIGSDEFFDKGLIHKAEDELIKSLKENPDNPSVEKAILLQANIDFLYKNYNIAEGQLEDFIRIRPNSPFISHAALFRAYIAFEQEKFDAADKYFNEAKIISEREFDKRGDSIYKNFAHKALFWRGISLVHQGKYQDAQPVFEECYRNYSGEQYADDALFALGLTAEVNRQYEVAVNYFNTIAKKYPRSNTFIAARIREINNRLVLRDPVAAITAIENASLAIEHIRNKDSIGNLYEEQSMAKYALEDLQYLRGEANNLAGNFDQAILIFKSFLETYYYSRLLNYVRLGAGWALLNINENKEALRYYDDVILNDTKEESPVRAIALLYKAVALKRGGNIEQAQKELSDLVVQSTYQYLGQALLELGQIYYEAGKTDEARRTLERADREARDAMISVRVHLLLGATYLELRIYDKAVAEYQAAEQLAKKSSYIFMPQKDWYLAESRLKKGIALVLSHRNGEAVPSLQAFIAEGKKDSRTDEALFWLAEAYYRSDNLNNAAKTYQSLLDKFPSSSRREEALYGQGWSYFRMKEFKNSSSIFEQLNREFPSSKFAVEVLARQGDGYYYNKNYAKASEFYRKAAVKAPKTDEGQYCAYQLCFALYHNGSYEQAITSLLNFVKDYPNSSFAPYALYLNGWIRFQQKSYDEAIDNFKFLILRYSQSALVPRAHYAIGDANFNKGDYEAAIAAYKQVVELFPSSPLAPEAMRGIQYCFEAQGKDDEAINIAQEYIETNPSSPFAPEFKFKKGEMFYSGRKFNDAINEYQEFIKKYPENEKNDEALYWMGKSYNELVEPDNADRVFAQLRQKYPKSEYAPLSMLEQAMMQKQLNNIYKADSIFLSLQKTYPASPSAAQAGYERALIKFSLNDTIAAVTLFREVAEKYPGKEFAALSIYRIAMQYRSEGKYDAARMEFGKLTDLHDNPPLAAEAQFRIGELWMRDKNCDSAIAAFKTVKEKFAGYEDWFTLSLLNMGECLEKQENIEAAKELYLIIETLHGDDDYGKTVKLRLKRLKRK